MALPAGQRRASSSNGEGGVTRWWLSLVQGQRKDVTAMKWRSGLRGAAAHDAADGGGQWVCCGGVASGELTGEEERGRARWMRCRLRGGGAPLLGCEALQPCTWRRRDRRQRRWLCWRRAIREIDGGLLRRCSSCVKVSCGRGGDGLGVGRGGRRWQRA